MATIDIQKRRKELGYSQSEFAKVSGVNFRTLQDYEQGRKPLSSVKGDVLLKLSNALGCSIEDLLIDTNAEVSESEMLDRMNTYFNAGKVSGLRGIISLVKDGNITIAEAAKRACMSQKDFKKFMEEEENNGKAAK